MILTRRQLGQGFFSFMAAQSLSFADNRFATNRLRVGIIGAGLAGLTAGYRLLKNHSQQFEIEVFEASPSRIGGRTYTVRNFFEPGSISELGGETISKSHKSILNLCRELNIDVISAGGSGAESSNILSSYVDAHGVTRLLDAKGLALALKPAAKRLAEDIGKLNDEAAGFFEEMDQIPIWDYMKSVGVPSSLKKFFSNIIAGEFGTDIEINSAAFLNYVLSFNPDLTEARVFPNDEGQFKIKNGSDFLPQELAMEIRRRGGKIWLNHRVTNIKRGSKFGLKFAGNEDWKIFDILIIAIPFSVLRGMMLESVLTEKQTRAVTELDYGTNTKWTLDYSAHSPLAQKKGLYLASGNEMQTSWLSSAGRVTQKKQFTLFYGGRVGRALGLSDTGILNRSVQDVEFFVPGLDAYRTSQVLFKNWSKNPLSLGSYSSVGIGYSTKYNLPNLFKGRGGLYFAGEHLSTEAQAFMSGAVQTGEWSAKGVLADFTSVASLI